MNRGLIDGGGRAVLWHNFYGSEHVSEEEVVATFEENAALLAARKNGNVLYHEILSFSAGHAAEGDALYRMVADVGQEYLRERAPDQLAYGVVHLDTGYIHLHLMLSANPVGRSERVRLSKEAFSEAQKKVERFTLERYKELGQTCIYDRERPLERLKTDVHEQAMKIRTGLPSRKEHLKASLHQLLEGAESIMELAELAKAAGFTFYQRGKSAGVIVREPGGRERKHRLSTLGVQEHYAATHARFSGRSQEQSRAPETCEAKSGKAASALQKEIKGLLRDDGEGPHLRSGDVAESVHREQTLRETLEKSRSRDSTRMPDDKERVDRGR
ncbi:MAG: relaxase/mobilization nuclease domain-containing protein [Burkholderiales bacterium]